MHAEIDSMSNVALTTSILPSVSSDAVIQRYVGRTAIGNLAPMLSSAGMLPTSTLVTDPDYLAAGHEGENPQALVAFRDGSPVAYFPFLVRRSHLAVRVTPRSRLRIPYRQLRLVGYQATLDAPSWLAAKILHAAVRDFGEYHLGVVSEIPFESPLANAVLSWETLRRGDARVSHSLYDSFRVATTGTFHAYLESHFTAKGRYNLRRTLRRFETEFTQVNARRFNTVASVDEFLRDAETVSRRSYQWSRGLPAITATPCAAARLRYLAGRGVWRSYILYAGNEPCAYCSGMLYRDVYDYDVVGYDERYAAFSPGTVLLLAILEELCDSQAAKEIDFGAGPGAYKHHFATHRAQVMYANVYPPGLYAWMLKGAQSSSAGLVAFAKALLRRGAPSQPRE